MSEDLAGTAGPHVFVESLEELVIDPEDLAHLARSLRMRVGDPLTASDGNGRWRTAALGAADQLIATGDIVTVPALTRETTVAFSLVKGQKPELVIQKLTELGVHHIVVLSADRSIVRWDDLKVDRSKERWNRIIREAGMQSHRVRLPSIEALVPSLEWLAGPDVALAHFGGLRVNSAHSSIAIGPEGGWSPAEIEASTQMVTLGPNVLRAETAAIAAGVLLTAGEV